MTITIYETDSLEIAVNITNSGDGSALDLTGSTLEASAQYLQNTVAGAVAVVAAVSGDIKVTFADGGFADNPGKYVMQVRVTKAGEVQTVVEEIIKVKPSV